MTSQYNLAPFCLEEKNFSKMDKRYYDPRSTYEIDAEYVDNVSLLPEHLAIKEDSEMLKHFHMNLVTVSLRNFFLFTMVRTTNIK